jgi:hydroxymethylpyrimidine pyrophosphatase-like HAD family hydrolase
MALFCGGLYGARPSPEWRAPIVALDIDGVIDRRLMGFPTSSLAGAQALALLGTNRISVVVDTARSIVEVQDYCRAYRLAGGVAEYGGAIWDAVAGRSRCLVGAQALEQMETLRAKLRTFPGVFLDDRHRYSVRAFTYVKTPDELAGKILAELRTSEVGDGALAPLPVALMNEVMAELNLDKLAVHQTSIDTMVTARDVDKGVGLKALRDWTLGPDAATAAVGDSDPDLAMFAVATRAFAPANLGPKVKARLLDCRIARRPFQQGLLEIAERLVADHAPTPIVRPVLRTDLTPEAQFIVDALRAADAGLAGRFAKAVFNRDLLAPFIG